MASDRALCKNPDIMQSDRKEESTSLLLSQGPALLWPSWERPGTPRHQLHVWQPAEWLQCQSLDFNDNDSQKTLNRASAAAANALFQEAKIQTTSPTKSCLNTVTRETTRDALGWLGCREADGFSLWCWASWRAGCNCWPLHTIYYYCYYTEHLRSCCGGISQFSTAVSSDGLFVPETIREDIYIHRVYLYQMIWFSHTWPTSSCGKSIVKQKHLFVLRKLSYPHYDV